MESQDMRVAVVGSRTWIVHNLHNYLPPETTEIVSGGAKGVDRSAKQYADLQGIRFKEFLPDYERYGRAAPIKRNDEILEYAEYVIAFWDGRSRGTAYIIEECKRRGIPFQIVNKNGA